MAIDNLDTIAGLLGFLLILFHTRRNLLERERDSS